MSTLKTILVATELDELRAARRHLLMNPLVIQRVAPEMFRIIARHRQTLQGWFAEQVGWKLVVDRDAGFARLHKVSAHLTTTHAAQVAGRAAFNRRRYVLLCLALAALEESPGQTTLARLAELIEGSSSADTSLEPFDANLGPERRALVDALRFLIERSVLTVRDGDAEGYLASRESGDALFDVNDRLLAQCISAPMPPALLPASAEDPMSLLQEVYPETDEGQRQRSRHQVLRRLLDEPVVYYEELVPREREWLLHSLGFVESLLESQVGLHSERHREGMAAVDPQGELTDVTFPDGGSTAKHATLLLCERLASRGAQALGTGAGASFSTAELLEIMEQLIKQYGERCAWSVAYRSGPEGVALLLRDSIALLAAFRLLERAADGQSWRPTPAVARFRPLEPSTETKSARRRGASTS